jgi:hypothetical protein
VRHAVALSVVLTNFYWVVLYFSAERLKVGILFLVLSILTAKQLWISFLFATAAILAHHSLIFIYGGVCLVGLGDLRNRKNPDLKGSAVRIAIVGSMLLAAVLLGYKDIWFKLQAYLANHESANLRALGPVLVLVTISSLYAKRIIEPVLLYLPVVVGTALLGGSRLNMLAYILFLYYGLRVRGGYNFGVIATAIYLGYKSLGFVANVVEHGHGFP